MKVDNPLTREFLLSYPVEAARTLEQVSSKHVASFFNTMPPQISAVVVTQMLPDIAAACLDEMNEGAMAKLVAELPIPATVRIYRLLPTSKQEQLSRLLTDKTRNRIQRHLEYPVQSAGALLDPGIDMLPENITAAEAIRRINRFDHPVSCEIYILDDAHHLVGLIELGKLLTASGEAKLRDLMNRKTQPIASHASTQTLLTHPGWMSRRRLPVVERDNTLVGVLHYSRLSEELGETDFTKPHDTLENLVSLVSLYWLTMAKLLESMFNISQPGKGDQK